jgi:hypothetical protein
MNIVELERTLWATADKLRANKDIDEQALAKKIIERVGA